MFSDTSYYAVDLHEGTSYEFRVFAENRVGLSEPSKTSSAVVAKDPWNVPGRPVQPRVSKMTRRSCILTWLPPDHDGGNPIRNYVVEYRVSNAGPGARLVLPSGNPSPPPLLDPKDLVLCFFLLQECSSPK